MAEHGLAGGADRPSQEGHGYRDSSQPTQGPGDVVPFPTDDLADGDAAHQVARPPGRDRQGLIETRVQSHAQDHGDSHHTSSIDVEHGLLTQAAR